MPLLPIVEREMRVTARRPKLYRARAMVVLLALVLVVIQLWYFAGKNSPTNQQGREIFIPFSLVCLVCALAVGPFLTSDSISVEKREGTLGLLFLTSLKGYDVVLGKIGASAIVGIYALLGVVPILAIPLLMGGISIGQFVMTTLALITAMTLSIATSLWVSSRSINERKAFLGSLLIVLAWLFMPLLAAASFNFSGRVAGIRTEEVVLMFSPVFLVVFATGGGNMAFPKFVFPCAIILFNLISVVFFLKTCAQIRRFGDSPRADKTKFRWKIFDRNKTSFQQRAVHLAISPMVWLNFREKLKPQFGRIFVGSLFFIGAFCIMILGGGYDIAAGGLLLSMAIIHFILKVWMASEASLRFSEDKRLGAMELLLSTPLTDRELIWGQRKTLQLLFRNSFQFLFLAEALLLLFNAHLAHEENVKEYLLSLLTIATCVLDLKALSWAGMWFGLKIGDQKKAMTAALLRIVLIPSMIFFFIWALLRFASFSLSAALIFYFVLSTLFSFFYLLRYKALLLTQFRAVACENLTRD